MSHMQRQIVLSDWYAVETTNGTEFIEADLVRKNPTNDDFEDYCEGEVESFELKTEKWGARLSAPGYMDRTDWTIHDTAEEAAKYLEETYPEDEDE